MLSGSGPHSEGEENVTGENDTKEMMVMLREIHKAALGVVRRYEAEKRISPESAKVMVEQANRSIQEAMTALERELNKGKGYQ